MALLRPTGMKNEVIDSLVAPGDILGLGEVIGGLSTVGAGTWTGQLIAGGIINRTGPAGGYTDTTDSAANILAALAGNAPNPEVLPGTTFRLLFINQVAFLMTFAAGAGVTSGIGVLNCAVSTWREYLFTVLNSSPQLTMNSTFLTASPTINFVLPPGLTSFKMGPDPSAVNITPGMVVTGTGIAANSVVIGTIQGQGGITGVTLNNNTTAPSAAAGNVLTFSPNVRVDSLRNGTL